MFNRFASILLSAAILSPQAMAGEGKEFVEKLTNSVSQLQSYKVISTKQNFVKGQMTQLETVFMKHRREDNCVYMRWVKHLNSGREMIWCPDRYGGRLQVHDSGGYSSATVSIDPDNKIAQDGNIHSVYNIGLWKTGKLFKALKTEGAELTKRKVGKEPSVCMETAGKLDIHGEYTSTKQLVCIHEKIGLPTEVKLFKGEQLMEHYTWRRYKVDPNLKNKDFSTKNPSYRF